MDKPAKPETVSVDDARRAEPTVAPPDALALQELQNSHSQNMHNIQRGWMGTVFGSGPEKAGNVAAGVVFSCIAMVVYLEYRLDLKADLDTFLKAGSFLVGPLSLALGYMFGSAKSEK